MRKMYTTKRLLGTVACATTLFAAATAIAQEAAPAEEVELFDNAAEEKKTDQQVKLTDTGPIDMHVKDLEVTKVLQMLSIRSQRNIIASRSVENVKVSADLYGVDFYEALKHILEPNGFGYIEEGNFIYVLTAAEIEARKDANRKVAHEIVRLDWLRADETAALITPMLSDRGSITVTGSAADGFQPSIDNGGSDSYAGPQTMILRDYEDNLASLKEVIAQLDTQPKQVIIEATILNTSLAENNQFGVDFSLFTDLTGTSPLDIIDGAISGGKPGTDNFGAITSNVGDIANKSGGVKLGFVAGDASVFVHALDSVNDTTVIASPKTTVLDRQRADIQVGERIPFLTTTVSETTSTQTIEFLDTGTQLSVRPFVSSDGKVRLELRPSVSSAESVTVGTGQTAPQEDTVEMITNVIVESGQTIVLGGLFTESTGVNRSQIPGLGDIPIFGNAFRSQSDTVSRSEVIFMVKATVVESEALDSVSKEMMARVDVAKMAERMGTLPWSRTQLTSAHIVNARKYYDQAMGMSEGKARDKKMADALYCVDLALHLNPSMVDALILKEKITGEASYIKYQESLINQGHDAVLDAEIKALNLPEAPVKEDEAVQAEALIEPEALADAETEAAAETDTEPTAPVAEAPTAEAPIDLFEAILDEEAALSETEAGLETQTPAQADPAEEGAAPVEELAEVEEVAPYDDTDPTQVEESEWRELTTAELLKLAADAESEDAPQEATDEDAQADAEQASDTETDNSTADVETETD